MQCRTKSSNDDVGSAGIQKVRCYKHLLVFKQTNLPCILSYNWMRKDDGADVAYDSVFADGKSA